jgi:hypothetical protein
MNGTSRDVMAVHTRGCWSLEAFKDQRRDQGRCEQANQGREAGGLRGYLAPCAMRIGGIAKWMGGAPSGGWQASRLLGCLVGAGPRRQRDCADGVWENRRHHR